MTRLRPWPLALALQCGLAWVVGAGHAETVQWSVQALDLEPRPEASEGFGGRDGGSPRGPDGPRDVPPDASL